MITPRSEITKNRIVTGAILSDQKLLGTINDIVDACVKALRNGNKIMFAGNGGSAADAQHLAAEIVGKLNIQRPPLAAIALTTDTSAITAIGNDYGFEHVFSRQIQGIGKSGDILIAISTSGNSQNILNAIATAKSAQIKVFGMTGEGGKAMEANCDLLLKIPSTDTQRIQESHILIGHTICGMIEQRLFG